MNHGRFFLLLLGLSLGASAASANESVRYNRDIRPILSENCFACHGPDKANQKAGLRLDDREAALAPAKSGDRAIVPGNVNESTLIARILTADENEIMPPPKSHKILSAAQKELLKRWVAEGAKYEAHWAFEKSGPESRKPGTYAANCLLARRLAERGVRFIQLYHRGWDQHANLPSGIKSQCYDTDQPTAALLADLKSRGLFEDTLVVWGGEFGRTVYSQGTLTAENYGRDHHPRCYSIWVAGAGLKRGHVIGRTDDFSYNAVEDPIHIHDLNATLLHLLGVDHTAFTYRHQGRDYRLTDVHGHVVKAMLS